MLKQNEKKQKKDKSIRYFEQLELDKKKNLMEEEQYKNLRAQQKAIKIHNNYIDNNIFVNKRFSGEKIKPKYNINNFS